MSSSHPHEVTHDARRTAGHGEIGRSLMRRWLPVVVAVAALVVVGIAAQGTGVQWREGEVLLDTEGTVSPPAFETMPEETMTSEQVVEETGEPSLPSWVSWLILGILVGAPVALILALLARQLVRWLVDARAVERRREADPQYLHRDVALVEEALAAGLAEIDLGTDPRSAIIACWVHFESAAERVGIQKEASDTPADLVRRLLERHELEGASLTRLSRTYLRARYSPHEVGEDDRDRARSALLELQHQLGVKEAR
ncbi:DUF4129 domain-containing protein [Glycomyces tenuis]|uniref:DUF4129 domain-containing protein n=1 Tax=Glycomyces tenuis TaxID=58116 RepID=UPI0004042BCB|nr:DUF4129 domain-containing protein [Glycomyces tenuis]